MRDLNTQVQGVYWVLLQRNN